jgi:hypothetical protein
VVNGLNRAIARIIGCLGLSFCLSLPVQAGNLEAPLTQKVLTSISGVQVVVTELPNNPRPNLVYFLPHQDERIAREAAYQLLPETGGKIVEIRQPEVVAQRSGPCRNLLLNGTWLDPNQMFTSEALVLATFFSSLAKRGPCRL